MVKEIDKLAWLYIKDKKVLCARSKGKETYYIPGGKRDPGESDQEALIREIREELSVDINANSVEYYGPLKAQADGKPEGTMVKVTCYQAGFTGELSVDSEIEEMAWLDSNDIDKCSVVVKHLFNDLKDKQLIL
ncbi:MAG: DNA mismatch repair protein MutT [Colwelliaceae bacterium]|nr:DNA mismatch repair protein MutT [Colwelliaceae bacterium]